MNQQQFKDLLRQLISTFGGGIAGFFVAKGWFTADQVISFLNSPAFIGFMTSAAAAVWGYLNHSAASQVASVNALPEVAGVVTAPTPEGKALAQAIPSETVVSAGTTKAVEIAKNGV